MGYNIPTFKLNKKKEKHVQPLAFHGTNTQLEGIQ